MCLAAIALDQHPRFPLVIAANRDEYLDRPASMLDWWMPPGDSPAVLAGRDLKAGGTWLGVTAAGRFGLVTNVRRPMLTEPSAPSRGEIVLRWLGSAARADRFWPSIAMAGYAPFNLIAADFQRGECFWASNEDGHPRRLDRGVFGLSNAALDTPWPKVQALKARLTQALLQTGPAEQLRDQLFAALADGKMAPDAALPQTGVPLTVERMLSPAFIRSADGRYGTRCSTVLITERIGTRLITQVYEQTHDTGLASTPPVQRQLLDWPPVHSSTAPLLVPIQR
ncbi:MAG TPA: NRDE family protein [Ideonella sp.]|uniref:NRDE family protein n=1 Tax=Ideonella sp. TaxID=1929293 RepID=UPI002CB8EA93|nr:NRDE family protein [Ideonella sp.]HSI51226.1 NRDE family protein [Ideonella sp.]